MVAVGPPEFRPSALVCPEEGRLLTGDSVSENQHGLPLPPGSCPPPIAKSYVTGAGHSDLRPQVSHL